LIGRKVLKEYRKLQFVNKKIGFLLQRKGTWIYLGCMENHYSTLNLLASIVNEIPQPTQYQCLPRQLILLSNFDWTTIFTHLQLLEKEGLVTISQADTIQFSITKEGICKAAALEMIPVK
jgi:predicted transcriptional regulator